MILIIVLRVGGQQELQEHVKVTEARGSDLAAEGCQWEEITCDKIIPLQCQVSIEPNVLRGTGYHACEIIDVQIGFHAMTLQGPHHTLLKPIPLFAARRP